MQGRIQDFHLGGVKGYVPARTLQSAESNSLSAGVQGPLKGPGSSMVVLMLLNILIKKNGGKIVDPILGGRLLRPPWMRHWYGVIMHSYIRQ